MWCNLINIKKSTRISNELISETGEKCNYEEKLSSQLTCMKTIYGKLALFEECYCANYNHGANTLRT